ncbi:MAG: hypothetical protein OXI27_10905 [Thaumarchaeota archaeon]|nr:hypothetical protein [Nitrososphaerota archaeon]
MKASAMMRNGARGPAGTGPMTYLLRSELSFISHLIIFGRLII